ncbi:4-(cytidine 5'-diphospho)-2-C-methyl-D-erythritol kinase [Chloroflexota bacterium]
MCLSREAAMLTVLAPAKLNLTLEVLSVRPDGFHEVRSVAQTISLCDSLHFYLSQNIEFRCDAADWIPEESLISRAVSLLRDTTGCSKGAGIEVKKRIPLMSGMGGDSSGAAATLWGLNKLWDLGLAYSELADLAIQLGSDVAFFLCGGTALLQGSGEIVTPLPPSPHMWVVLLVPSGPRPRGKTGKLYASLEARHYTDGQITEKLVNMMREGRGFTSSDLFNTFENVADTQFPGLSVYREHILKVGAAGLHLAGSGPSLFTMIEDMTRAEDLYVRLKQQGLESYLTETLIAID